MYFGTKFKEIESIMEGAGESWEQDMEAGGHDASIVRRKDSVGGQLAVSFLIQSRAPASGMVLCLFRAVLGNFQHLEDSGKNLSFPCTF